MVARVRRRWWAVLDHPVLRLELRRVRRRRWWPGRRFFLFYPALLGAALGCSVVAALTESLDVRLAALATGLPVACLVSVVTWLLSATLPWIAPALAAATIARERELGTLDLLRVTQLSERSIVLGKLGGCLVQLWPGILVLMLLSPFQIIRVATFGGGGGMFGSYVPVLLLASSQDDVLLWVVWLTMVGVTGWLRQWGDLALNTTVGLFASVLCSSSGIAVAVSYGAILVLRAALWLANALLIPLLAVILVNPVGSTALPSYLDHVGFTALAPALLSLTITLGEIVGAVLLVWAGVHMLKRR